MGPTFGPLCGVFFVIFGVSFRRAWRAHPNSAANGEREESACGRADRCDARDAAVHPAPQLPPREHASAGGDA